MAFEVGKTYECRDGTKTSLVSRMNSHPFFSVVKGDDGFWRWEDDGRIDRTASDSKDLINEIGVQTPVKTHTGPLKIK
jgi:hypothetical protein